MTAGRGPSAVDRMRVDRRLERLEQICDALAGTAVAPVADLLADEDRLFATERRLQVGVQAAIDVAAHVASACGWPTAEGYAAVFDPLSRHGVLPVALSKRLAQATGLRNLLVHDYLEIDPSRLHATLADDVTDLRAFIAAILAWLATGDAPAAP